MPNWAIVVGINDYPGTDLGQLQGAVADACDFAEWALTKGEGDVPQENLFFWTYPWPGAKPAAAAGGAAAEEEAAGEGGAAAAGPAAKGAAEPPAPEKHSELDKYLKSAKRPDWKRVLGGPGLPDENRAPHAWEIVKTIEKAGRTAFEEDKDAQAEGGPADIPRRVYVFFAGHGILGQEDGGDFQTCFVAGNFEPPIGENIGGLVASVSLRASLFSARFTEVLLFLDCCRLKPTILPMSIAPLCDALFPASGTQWGLGLAAEPDKAAYEINAPPMRGAFSKVLVEGLRNYREPVTGELRIPDLDKFVAANITPPPGKTQRPKLTCQEPSGPLIAKSPPTAKPGPLVNLSALAPGTKVVLLDGSLQPVAHVPKLEAGADPIQLPPLADGLYVLVVESETTKRAPFEQPVARTIDVK